MYAIIKEDYEEVVFWLEFVTGAKMLAMLCCRKEKVRWDV